MRFLQRMGKAWRLARDIVWLADSTPLRFLMGICSIGWGIALAWEKNAFEYPIYRLMALMAQIPIERLHIGRWVSPEAAWGFAFMCYGGCVLWRILEGKPRMRVGVTVNFGGFVLWSGSTLCMTLALGHFSLTTIVEWVISVQLLLVAIRTGLNDDMSSP